LHFFLNLSNIWWKYSISSD